MTLSEETLEKIHKKIRLPLGLEKSENNFYGLELAVINARKAQKGIQLGGLNIAGENHGLQTGLCNIASTNIGSQIGILNIIYYNECFGVQAGIVNASYQICGVQIGITNLVEELRGAQISAIYNVCGGTDTVGVQLGLINYRSGNPWYSRIIPLLAIRTKRKRNIPPS